MFCPKCGTSNLEDSAFCNKCGAPLKPVPATAPGAPVQASGAGIIYAGFWRRFAAFLLDGLILGAAVGLLELLLWIPSLTSGRFSFGSFGLMFPISIAGYWLYYALQESSARQATIGKMALSIIVTGLDGKRVSFGKATGRYFGKFLSGFILGVGYLMIAF